jgi:xanthine dehydrogenase accessory factor
MALRVLIRGGGDLASGVALRLRRIGCLVLITELSQPKAVRRAVSFAQAVYDGTISIEGILGRRVDGAEEVESTLKDGAVPVMVDPDLSILAAFKPHVIVDCRMLKRPTGEKLIDGVLTIGIGPGFAVGKDCHVVVESNRGPFLGRVIWSGSAQEDTQMPEAVGDYRGERVLRSPTNGQVIALASIGTALKQGDVVAQVAGQPVYAPFNGVLRGLIHDGVMVAAGEKIGDVDPRGDVRLCWLVSEKALAVGGGVLEAILSWRPLRAAFSGNDGI